MRPTPDTGDYHYPAIRWLAEFGSVAGVAHLIERLGFVSSVFSPVAPFDAAFPTHALPVVNGFMLCLVAGQAALVMRRIVLSAARPSDWFLAAASLAILGIGLLIGSFTTPTPDVSVMVLTIAAAWRMLTTCESTNSRSFVPLILCCGALRNSGIALVPVTVILRLGPHGTGSRRAIATRPYAFALLVRDLQLLAPRSAVACRLIGDLTQHSREIAGCRLGAPPAGAGPLDWIRSG